MSIILGKKWKNGKMEESKIEVYLKHIQTEYLLTNTQIEDIKIALVSYAMLTHSNDIAYYELSKLYNGYFEE